MKTIEVRAYRKVLRMMCVDPMARPTTRELLVEMAIEQRKIDIEEASKWFEHFCKRSGLCDREWQCTICPRIIELKQAMEENV